jgi:hypothetical protein
MSGRSAYVRKEKTKIKDGGAVAHEGGLEHSSSILGEFPVPNGRPKHFEHDLPIRRHGDLTTIKSGSSGSEDLAYARVRKPHVPIIIDSGIEKSSFRSLMDKKSEEVRKGLAKTFGSKKKKHEESRPPTSATVRPETHEMDAGDYFTPPPPAPIAKSRTQQFNQPPEYIRPGPPSAKLPPIPQGPQLKRWMGAGRPPQPWNKLRKDPELWDPNGDTLIFFGHETHQSSRPPPSFRLSSHVLEATESRFLITLLREGSTEEATSFSMPPSPIGSPSMRPAFPVQSGRHHPTPPTSENSVGAYDGQISYEIYFPAPLHQSNSDTIRHQVTTRNVFAVLYQASLVGMNLYQALSDLQERLETYMPPDTDVAGMIIEYLMARGIDDVHENPSVAAAILAWSETQAVRWEEGWREAYVHSAGMYNRLESTADFRFVTPITRALLERASLEVQVRVQNCEDRLSDFDFGDMWPLMSSEPPPARGGFERLRKFFSQYYLDAFGIWPPASPTGEEQWLTRGLAQKIQKDFGALYDYLVNRDVTWDCSEERSGRKWNIVDNGNRSFDADTFDLPFTDLLVAFDNRHKYPHIPHPYPLVPESIPTKSSKDNLFKASKKTPKPDDKMAERRAALAYTESTNIYLLGSDFVNNDMVDAFVRFEKADRAAEVDPYAARRGRWILIYGILQTLASVSVDTPNLRYTGDVSYHLNPRLRGTPPWKGANQNVEEANHLRSHCWTIRDTWRTDAPVTISRRPENTMSSTLSQATSVRSSVPSYSETINESDAGSSNRAPFSPASSRTRSTRNKYRLTSNSDKSAANYSAYGPGIEKVEEWPIREESRSVSRAQKDFKIKDFDDYSS